MASAPSVSPHYVPPAPPVIQPVVAAPVVPPVKPEPRQIKMPEPELKPQLGLMKQATNINTILSAPRPPVPAKLVEETSSASDGFGFDDVVELATDAAEEAKKAKDKLWRWTTIGVSCAGGLASGWLGSNVSEQAGGFFSSSVQTIVGKASEPRSHTKLPVSMKMVRDGVPTYMSGDILGSMTGKTDRAIPHDDNLCTVLELDRGTGLTLAKPCKPIETAEFNSTLGKSDLLVKPR